MRTSSRSRTTGAAVAARPPRYVLRLYITGVTPRSRRAVANVKRLCEEYLPNRYALEIIDIYQQPHLAAGDQILAAPTLIKRLPLPLRRLIGDLSNKERTLLGLDLQPDRPAPKLPHEAVSPPRPASRR